MIFVFFLIIVTFVINVQSDGVCRVLALSGGGNKGAYEAGVVKGFVDNLPGHSVQWNVVSGISAGSINTAAMACFAIREEKNMSQQLVQIAGSLTNQDIYRKWPGGVLEGVFSKTSIFDSSPLREFLNKTLHSFGGLKDRHFLIGAVSYNTGKMRLWDESYPLEDVVIGAQASAAIPGVFERVQFRGDNYADGGTLKDVNIASGIDRCIKDGYPLQNISVDVILCSNGTLPVVDENDATTIALLRRASEISSSKTGLQLVQDAIQAFPEVEFRYLVYPTQTLPGTSDLDFSPKVLSEMIRIGESDAKNAITSPIS